MAPDNAATADPEILRQRLENRLHWLENRLHRIEASLDAPRSADFAEQATEAENDEVKESMGREGLLEIEQIRAALSRIASGTYGICPACGAPIAPARLNAVPHAARCVACA